MNSQQQIEAASLLRIEIDRELRALAFHNRYVHAKIAVGEIMKGRVNCYAVGMYVIKSTGWQGKAIRELIKKVGG